MAKASLALPDPFDYFGVRNRLGARNRVLWIGAYLDIYEWQLLNRRVPKIAKKLTIKKNGIGVTLVGQQGLTRSEEEWLNEYITSLGDR